MYAKLENNQIVLAPKLLRDEKGLFILNPTAEHYKNAGYLPVVFVEEPLEKDGFYAQCSWEQTENEIVQKWRYVKSNRHMTAAEVNRMLIAQQINTLAVDDNTALRMRGYYPEWAAGIAYEVSFKVQHDGKLWRVLQAHTSQDGWQPENAPSLWEQINETHSGELLDPIPYDGNMALENGKYYFQNYTIYLCNRDTVNPVYSPLADLVGLYVEIV